MYDGNFSVQLFRVARTAQTSQLINGLRGETLYMRTYRIAELREIVNEDGIIITMKNPRWNDLCGLEREEWRDASDFHHSRGFLAAGWNSW